MRVPRIYHPDPINLKTETELSSDAFQHLIKVLRLNVGDNIVLFNGDGHNYDASITSIQKKSAHFIATSYQVNNSESPIRVHLAQVISRGDRMDFVLQKSVELGATEITPLFSERCGVKLSGDRLEKKQQQWQKIVQSACEQCGRSVVPPVKPAQQLNDFVQSPFEGLKLTLDPTATKPLSSFNDADKGIQLLIGPEGGFSEAEVHAAEQHGFKPMRLGPRILRTETAALSALTAVQYQFGDLC
ncbi:16S rRNA (uracil(1498)-N(3))-methyltransferase [Idiomarina sp. HP20-50]|uniref:16S rRNA (uracil(1498)-N(3))-methyltransferase n=1 Tax=Idiomarina sp. HP20-50 TaxID=3070813 RepID=UPI00294B84C7|nr:16S rRNA (uracil(1498)-N(3))-methyltransferase [Idiomarina sp. HP20-50]MDV6315596.1 16S rRNA (uracil(1498)-N(3))-methyltransferase [Idiomarina sp. HP20-50]